VVDGALLVRVLRGFWTGEGHADEFEAVKSAKVEPFGDGPRDFVHGEGQERILVSVAEIPPRSQMRQMQRGHARARDLAAELREIVGQRKAEGRILTVRRASEILDVSQMEVANAAWWQGIRWLACRTRPRGSRRCCAAARGWARWWRAPAAGGMTEATIRAVCALALPGRTLTRWSYAA